MIRQHLVCQLAACVLHRLCLASLGSSLLLPELLQLRLLLCTNGLVLQPLGFPAASGSEPLVAHFARPAIFPWPWQLDAPA